MSQTLVLYAPNVYTGGGFVLLKSLLAAWPTATRLRAVLDARARLNLVIPPCVDVLQWVQPSVTSRWAAEKTLRAAADVGDTVLCFHGLPPLLSNPGRVLVFLQNRIYFGFDPLSKFSLRTATRLRIERLVSRVFRHRVAEYLVQTPSMARDLARWHTAGNASAKPPALRVLPFVDSPSFGADARKPGATEWDFVYVADGEAHKNHRVLVEAWRLLAQDGLYPSLALTLNSRYEELKRDVLAVAHHYGLKITDLGQMPREDVLALYASACAMIFPSTSESFGLPLIEATQAGVPILASELDYVRDVCLPAQTFDPQSPVSIARAVKRFLGSRDPTVKLLTSADFWNAVLAR